MGISNREMRLGNRNLRKEPTKQKIIPWKPKPRSEYTKEELEEERRMIAKHNSQCREERKKRMLEKSERLAKEEKEEPWPPVWKPIKESIQYKCGMIAPFVDKRWDFEDMDDSDFNSKPKYADLRSKHGHDVLNKLKTFLAQVRHGRGYDVDWHPSPFIRSPFKPRNFRQLMEECPYFIKSTGKILECAVQRINARAKNHGEEYKLLELKGVVEVWSHRRSLFTFSVELIKHGRVEAVKDVQALIRFEGGFNYDCEEWRFKPRAEDEDGPSTDPILECPAKRKRSCNQDCIRRSTRLSKNALAAAYSEPPKKKKTKTKTKTETNSAKTIVIEHCKQCNSFKTRANQVKEALERDVNVVVNPEKPRRGSFEIREEGGEVFVSLLDMKRPFQPLKALDMEKLIADIVEKIW